jgi:hypothetical protein
MDVPNSIQPESLASSPGACQTGQPRKKGITSGIVIIMAQSKSSAATTIVSETIPTLV